MKNSQAKEMVLVFILTVLSVIVSIAHFIFMSFDLKEVFWIILNIVIAAIFIIFYSLRMQKGVFYTAVALFSFNAIYHLILAPREFVSFGEGDVLESISSLLYVISTGFLFLSYLGSLSSAVLERKRLFNFSIFGLFASAVFSFLQGIIMIFICNSGLKSWDACFPPLSQTLTFVTLAVIYLGDYIKESFKFLKDE